ncbi:Hsp20/alpha crystallin family protein [Azospirillum doebereinerae]|uniref:Hsp20/alpha crystallin family protein n=1 Tax=Azospirillum doebereinerae TaxID=92933 RepID=A0A3S0WZZ1_9PROT|nr:Hsp20/alpha crystallin family protein [Azospirillum doebereinerae]MCG5243909.1 Hsp20/alpha crystallin family protein [Azospirillum doebereinerae]RUQ72807.1 Hsp20/alpha crystallin family protein [Azospirillum doebereinerae]
MATTTTTEKPKQDLQATGQTTAAPTSLAAGALAERNRHPFLALRSEFDRLFDEASSMFRSPWTLWSRRPLFEMEPLLRTDGQMNAIMPAAEVDERETEYRVTLEMPGMEDKDVDVTLQDQILTIKAEKKEEKEEKERNRYFSERRYGLCMRSFQLPANVASDRIAASLRNGVLTVTLPKTEASLPAKRRIEITGA